MLSEGIARKRGRYGAYIHRDQVNRKLRARRGSRLAAITSGGAIPETALFTVVAEPEGMVVGTLDEDFAVESNARRHHAAGEHAPGGFAAWREKPGACLVEDAHGAPPTVPFWLGEAPARTQELPPRWPICARKSATGCGNFSDRRLAESALVAETVAWLKEECGLDDSAAEQAIEYILQGRAVLGAVPTQDTIIAERFFDEGGGMQLVIHAPFRRAHQQSLGIGSAQAFLPQLQFRIAGGRHR